MIYIKFYLKIFLVTAIPFGVMIGLVQYFSENHFDLKYIYFMGLFFGLTMSLLLGSIHIFCFKNELKDGHYTVLNLNEQSKEVNSSLTIHDIYQLLKIHLNAKKISLIVDEEIIKATIGLSMESWGEKVKVTIIGNQESNFIYKIESNPSLFSTVVDFGKNVKNINQIIEIIKNGR